MNNKGMTLVELLISIVLLSLVMVFLSNLLSDLQNEKSNNHYAYDNEMNRTEMIYLIEEDIRNNELTNVELSSDKNIITFTYSTNTSTLTIDKENKTISYKDSNNTTNKWTISNATIGDIILYDNNNIDTDNQVSLSVSPSSFLIKIPIYTTDDLNKDIDNNNPLDDIEISYFK